MLIFSSDSNEFVVIMLEGVGELTSSVIASYSSWLVERESKHLVERITPKKHIAERRAEHVSVKPLLCFGPTQNAELSIAKVRNQAQYH
jgi:hypothetical protein